MVAYGIGAAFAGLAAVTGAVPVLPVLGWAGLSFGAGLLDLWLGEGQVEPMGSPVWTGLGLGGLRNEIIREVLGLWLMSGWMGLLAWWTRRRTNS